MKRLVAGLALAWMQSGCLAWPLAVDAGHLVKLSVAKVPVEKVLQDPGLSAEARHKLELLEQAKRYAQDSLGLKVTRNYSAYVDTGRPVLSWTLQAAPPLELDHYYWKFPLVGSMPYMGFFNKEQGLKMERNLESKGYDALLRPVPTFALPLFADPATNCMLLAPDAYLVNLVIHETCHNTIAVKNYSTFNENVCEFIGNQGAVAFAEEVDGPDSELAVYARGFKNDAGRYTDFINTLAAKLALLYASPLTDAEKLTRKAEIFRQARPDYQRLCDTEMETDYFRRYLDFEWHNALVVYSQLYFQDQAVFDRVFAAHGRDLAATIAFLKGLEQVQEEPLRFLQQWLERRNEP